VRRFFSSHFFPAAVLLILFLATLAQAAAEDFWTSPVWTEKEEIPFPELTPLTYEEKESWYGSHFWKGSDWSRIGKGWFHPGTNTPAVLTFTAPKDGNASIRGNVRKLHLDGNDGILAEIRTNSQVLWKGKVEPKDSVGITHDLQLTLKKNDRLHFVVKSGPTIFCDTTAWDPEIVYGSETAEGTKTTRRSETFKASDGFSANEKLVLLDPRKPLSHWSYSLEKTRPQTLSAAPEELAFLRDTLKEAVAQGYEMPKDARLWKMLLLEWKRDDAPGQLFLTGNAGERQNDAVLASAGKHLGTGLRLYEALEKDLSALSEKEAEYLKLAGTKLKELSAEFVKWNASAPQNRGDCVKLYFQTRIWKRALIFSNPLIRKCGRILFVKRKPTSYDHLVMQYFGWRAQRGGSGLFILKEPGDSLACEDILKGKMDGGNIADPCLSWDGKKVIFSYVEIGEDSVRFPWKNAWTPKVPNEQEEDHREYYHLYEVNVDGTGLRQLTRGHYEDLMPAYLPDGSIVFVSSRRKGHPRCFWWGFGERWTNYTVHKMGPNGEDVKPLSWHETNEWYPTVGHDGQIFYARWDYIDRDAVTHQNLWSMRPDGTNPSAVWGNASLDIFCAFQAKPVPNSRKWILTASAHHACTGGSLVLLDPSAAKDGPSALERLTPEIPFPEAETNNIPRFYASPWPLSEDIYLVSFSPWRLEFEPKATRDEALGIYVLDRFGNRELLYRDPKIGSDSPQPLAARKRPPVIPSFLPEDPKDEGRFFVQDIYQGLGEDVKRGSIKELRVVQIFPKTTLTANEPPIGLAGEENGRAVLGTVPVEPDGSVNFIAPARKPILFQALNEKGEAYQIMRTLTYLQPGEEIACIGCHEDRTSTAGGNSPYFSPSTPIVPSTQTAPSTLSADRTGTRFPMAAAREPSRIRPGKFDGRPFSYAEAVQPIWDAKCVSCHGADPENEVFKKNPIDLTAKRDGAFSRSYVTLMKRKDLIPHWPQRNRVEVTEPGGKNGAIGSGLKKILANADHANVQLTDEEWAHIAMWIDQNAIFFGTTEAPQQSLRLQAVPVPMQEIQ